MHPFYLQSGVDAVGVVVSREEAESGDILPVLGTLQTLLFDAETVRAFQGRLNISFCGYEADPREIYEVDEVRSYLAKIDIQFPYWFYFLSAEDDMLRMLAFCLCRTKKVGPGLANVEPPDLQHFFLRHLDAMNKLFDRFQLDEAINERISNEIADCYFPRRD